jgi:SecD/SecF fusion protein
MKKNLVVKTVLIVLVLLWSIYALWPTYKLHTLTPQERESLSNDGKLVPLMNKAIRLGLDLQGGMYLTLDVDVPRLIEDLAKVKDDTFNRLIAQSREETNVSSEDFLTILKRKMDAERIPLNRYWGESGDSNTKIVDYLDKQAKDAMTRSLEILRNRVDQFGVSEPTIQNVGKTRILIELPGITSPDQAKELIGRTALLEFKLLKDPKVFTETIQKIDKALAREKGALAEIKPETAAQPDTTKAAPKTSQDKAMSVGELFGEAETATDKTQKDSSLTVDEATFKENPFLSLMRSTRQDGREVIIPVENVKAVEKILAKPEIQKLIPGDAQFLWSSETINMADKAYKQLYFLKKDAEITGKYLTDSRVSISSDAQNYGQPEVSFTLNRQGAGIFSRVTSANIDKFLGIILDGRVVSSPRIQVKIPNGQGRITGIGDMDEAKMVAIVLKAGAMPAPVSIIEERTVGPSLGLDSIKSGTFAAMLGAILVVLFMIVYYGAAGALADFALVMNILVLLAALAQFRFVLTLPGIAGIVLTIGMAVDANVLIFERIREELRTGKTVVAGIEAGYNKAWTAIFDSNFTTIISSGVLYWLGTGAVKGFAITLTIGLIINMFTAIVVTRTIYDHITSRTRLTKLSI